MVLRGVAGSTVFGPTGLRKPTNRWCGGTEERRYGVAIPFSPVRFSVPRPVRVYLGAAKTLGQQIKKRRVERGLSQGELAAAIGVAGDTVSLWERDRLRPGRLTLERLGQVLDPLPNLPLVA